MTASASSEEDFKPLPESEVDHIADLLEPVLQRHLTESLGSRRIAAQELGELTAYWMASATEQFHLLHRRRTGTLPRNLTLLSAEEICRRVLYQPDYAERNLALYNKKADTHLEVLIDKLLLTRSVARVLDIGCGSGQFLKDLREIYGSRAELFGIAPHVSAEADGLDLRLGLAEVLPEDWSNRFDLITCFDASMYFWNQGQAFDEMLRVIAPTGTLFYGTGGIKDSVDFRVLDARSGLSGFKFTGSVGTSVAGKTYTDSLGKWVSNLCAWDAHRAGLLAQGRFKLHGKTFQLTSRETTLDSSTWSNEILQVAGLGDAQQ